MDRENGPPPNRSTEKHLAPHSYGVRGGYSPKAANIPGKILNKETKDNWSMLSPDVATACTEPGNN